MLDGGPRLVRLFYYPTLTSITIDQLPMDSMQTHAGELRRLLLTRADIIFNGKKWFGPTWANIDENLVLRWTPTETEMTN